MNRYLAAAALLMAAIGAVHSFLGERMVFRRMRTGGIVPVNGAPVLREGHVRILWVSWHLVTVFGWCVALTLWWLADVRNAHLAAALPTQAAALALLAGALLVLVGTRGRHPGWIGLLVAAALTAASMFAR